MKPGVIASMLGAAALVAAAGGAAQLKRIQPHETALILVDGAVEREMGPGLQFLPFWRDHAIVSVHWSRAATVEVEATGTDGAPCPVTIRLITRTGDARQAYRWRKAEGVRLSDRPEPVDHPWPATLLRADLETASQTLGPKPRHDAVAAWLKAWGDAHPRFADGSVLQQAETIGVACAPAEPRAATVFLDPQPFSHRGAWRAAPAPRARAAQLEVTLEHDIIVRTRDGARLAVSGLSLTAAISDQGRFAAVLGSAQSMAKIRVGDLLEQKLTNGFAAIDAAEAAAFRFDALAADAAFTARLGRLGLSLATIDSRAAVFRREGAAADGPAPSFAPGVLTRMLSGR